MISWDRVSERVFGIIRGAGHRVTMFDSGGQEVTDPAVATRFFVKDPNYMVTVNADNREILVNRNRETPGKEIRKVLTMLKNLNREFLVKVNIRVFGKSVKPRDAEPEAAKARQQEKDGEEVLESNMYGRAKTSYQEFDDNTRLVIKHNREVNPEAAGDRSRSIREIYVEHGGERYPLRTRDLGAGRAVANHCAQGGNPQDEVAEYIQEMAGQVRTLQRFSSFNRRQQFSEDSNAQEARELAREHAHTLRQRIREFADASSYPQAVERFQNGETETVLAESDPELFDRYSETRVDPRVENALPIVTALQERHRANMLEASTQPFPIGPDQPCEEDILESDDPVKNLGFKVKRVVNRATESSALSRHVAVIAEKMIQGQEITGHERAVTRNVLRNVVPQGAQHEI